MIKKSMGEVYLFCWDTFCLCAFLSPSLVSLGHLLPDARPAERTQKWIITLVMVL